MPGRASLEATRYYAHPRNAFWPILSEWLGLPLTISYDARVHAVQQAPIVVWDVIAAAERPGSLDADIRRASMQINDFSGLLARHELLRTVLLNGGTADQLFRKHVLPVLGDSHDDLKLLRMPSTSPAYAARPFEQKRTRWLAALGAAKRSN